MVSPGIGPPTEKESDHTKATKSSSLSWSHQGSPPRPLHPHDHLLPSINLHSGHLRPTVPPLDVSKQHALSLRWSPSCPSKAKHLWKTCILSQLYSITFGSFRVFTWFVLFPVIIWHFYESRKPITFVEYSPQEGGFQNRIHDGEIAAAFCHENMKADDLFQSH